MDFGSREETSAPLRQMKSCFLEVVEEDDVGLSVINMLIPCLLDYLAETGHGDPEVFELESLRPPRPLIIGEQKRTMIGEGRGEGVEHMRVEGCVPLGVAEEGIKLA